MTDPVVLLVEDHEDNRFLARRLLTRAGFRVVEAVTGPQALEQAARVRPDLVLLDLLLPEIDGWTVARTLRQRPDLERVPIVAFTASAMDGDRAKALEAGCNAFMTKPIDVATFVPTIRRILERNGT